MLAASPFLLPPPHTHLADLGQFLVAPPLLMVQLLEGLHLGVEGCGEGECWEEIGVARPWLRHLCNRGGQHVSVQGLLAWWSLGKEALRWLSAKGAAAAATL
jgi:hypothetical protein